MATRTVRLDDEAEAALRQIREATGLPISEVFKRGLRSLLDNVRNDVKLRLTTSTANWIAAPAATPLLRRPKLSKVSRGPVRDAARSHVA